MNNEESTDNLNTVRRSNSDERASNDSGSDSTSPTSRKSDTKHSHSVRQSRSSHRRHDGSSRRGHSNRPRRSRRNPRSHPSNREHHQRRRPQTKANLPDSSNAKREPIDGNSPRSERKSTVERSSPKSSPMSAEYDQLVSAPTPAPTLVLDDDRIEQEVAIPLQFQNHPRSDGETLQRLDPNRLASTMYETLELNSRPEPVDVPNVVGTDAPQSSLVHTPPVSRQFGSDSQAQPQPEVKPVRPYGSDSKGVVSAAKDRPIDHHVLSPEVSSSRMNGSDSSRPGLSVRIVRPGLGNVSHAPSLSGRISGLFGSSSNTAGVRASAGLRTKYTPQPASNDHQRRRPPTLPRRPVRKPMGDSGHVRSTSAISNPMRALRRIFTREDEGHEIEAPTEHLENITGSTNGSGSQPKPEDLGSAANGLNVHDSDVGAPLTQKHSILGPLVSASGRPPMHPRVPSAISSTSRQSMNRRSANRKSARGGENRDKRSSRPISVVLKQLGSSFVSPVRFRDSGAEEMAQYQTDVLGDEMEIATDGGNTARYSWGSYGSAASFQRRLSLGETGKHARELSRADILAEQLERFLPGNNATWKSERLLRTTHAENMSVGQSTTMMTWASGVSYGAPKVEVKPWFSRVVCVILMIMFLVEIIVNGGFEPLNKNPTGGPSAETMLKLGAKKTDLIVENGDWYRLLLPMVLHAGVLHLLFNITGMFNIVMPAEIEFGHLKISMIFLFSGFFGELMSALFVPVSVGVGASGAIFGLFGACWADLVQNWTLYGPAAAPTGRRLLLLTVVNGVIGIVPLVDNFAHMGGLFFGFVSGLGLLVEKRFTSSGRLKPRKLYTVLLQLFALIALPILLIVPLAYLASGTVGKDICGWCSLINCVPTPLWDCTTCTTTGTNPVGIKTGEDVFLKCPLGNNFTIPHGPEPLTGQLVVQYCQQFCD